MTPAAILDFSATVLGVGTAAAVLLPRLRSITTWSFAAGMGGLAFNAAVAGKIASGPITHDALRWENWALLVMALQPALWLVFCLTYGRGNSREFLKRWQLELAAALLLPIALVALSKGQWVNRIGQLDNSRFSEGDFIDLPSLAGKLEGNADTFSTYLRSQMGPEIRKPIEEWTLNKDNARDLQQALVEQLNKIIARPSFATNAPLWDVKLRPETAQLLARKASALESVRLNRLLLEDAYPLELSRLTAATADYVFPSDEPLRMMYVVWLLGVVVVVAQIERTFWTAIGTMRWRLKFMVLGLGVIFMARFYTTSLGVLYPWVPVTRETIDGAALCLGSLLMLYSLGRGSFDAAVFPTRVDFHKSVSAIVAGIYLAVVGLSAKVAAILKSPGDLPRWSLLVLLVFVAVALLVLSDRLRLHARRFISRYLQRPIYDYRTVWRRFTEGTASCVTDLELCQSSVKLAADIFQALSVTIWLVDEKQENLSFAASTALTQAAAEKLRVQGTEAAEAISKLRHCLDPVDIEFSNEGWAIALRRAHPSEFGEEGGSRVCVPMIAGGKLLGLMILGDRVGGVLFSLQDYDLLKCVGDQIAAGLLNTQLSHRLLQAREMEAFQTMSAFFIHDLKNTASTLNLMLQNLPVHYDNPAFREDALRGIAKSGQHINNLILRLNELRQDFKIRPQEADLNDLVAKVLASWKGADRIKISTQFGPVPRVMMDGEQIHKVVTNLILNASEAIAGAGQIRVSTRQNNSWVELIVADNGCGMTPEFIHRQLFRAFQTTKKDGFGIGMFQSKIIVEAHGGRLEVESQLKLGSTFTLLLPLAKK